jgi:hypothetical protein
MARAGMAAQVTSPYRPPPMTRRKMTLIAAAMAVVVGLTWVPMNPYLFFAVLVAYSVTVAEIVYSTL